MCAPAEAADDVAKLGDRLEGGVKTLSADRVVDDVETYAAGISGK